MRFALVSAASFALGSLLLESSQAPNVQDPTRPVDGREDKSPEMRAALSLWMDVDLENTSLRQAVQTLAQQAKVGIVLDDACLASEDVKKDAPVTLHLKRVRLASILQIILDRRNLVADFRPDVIVVVDKESYRKTLIQKVYPVADLVLNGSRGWVDPTGGMLVRATEDLVDRDVWEPNGGDATMHFILSNLSLAVNAPPDTQLRVHALLTMLRTSRLQTVQLLEQRNLGQLEEVLMDLAGVAAPNP